MSRLAAAGVLAAEFALVLFVGSVPAASGVTLDAVGSTVVAVAVGSEAWVEGVRPGMLVVREWPEGTGYDVGGPSYEIGVPLSRPSAPLEITFVAAVLALIGVTLLLFQLPGVAVALWLASWLAVAPLLGRIHVPLAAAFVPMPLLVTALALEARRRLLTLTAAVLVGLIVLTGTPLGALVPWPLVWSAGGVAATGLLVVTAAHRARLANLRARSDPGLGRRRALGDELLPGVRHDRLRAVEQERRRTATQVHNELLPRLHHSLRSLGDQPTSSPAARELRELETELRWLMAERQTTILQAGGLMAGLGALAALVRERGISCRVVTLSSRDHVMSPEVRDAAYRIAQTALTNAVVHSGADEIVMELDFNEDTIRVSVVDDGVGIEPDAAERATRRGHIGLTEMRQWSSQVGGSLVVARLEPNGTSVTFECRR